MTGLRSLLFTIPTTLFLAGCPTTQPVDDSGGDTDTDTDTDTDVFVIPELNGHAEGFDLTAAVQQGYWYSRYNLGSLVMKSGNGTTFMPDMAMVGEVVTMVSDDDSTAMPPANPALLNRVYDSGVPYWANATDGDPGDFGDERWDPSSNTTTGGAAAGWTLLKEVEWARQFHVDAHFGVPGSGDGIPGAQQRFAGMVLYMESVNQAMEWMNNPTAFDTSDPGGQYVMMEALVDLSDATAVMAQPHSASNRYRMAADMMGAGMGMGDADALAGMFMGAADMIYASDPAVTDTDDLSFAVQSLTWYAAYNETNRADAKLRLGTHADALLAKSPSTAADHAHRVRGLIEAFRVTGDQKYQDGATESYLALEADFDWENGVFGSQSSYSVDDIGTIIGALNAADLHGDSSVERNTVPLIEHFFESSINLSGLQIAAPPMTMLPVYEQHGDEMLHRYPSLPMPPMAGGDNGMAPVFASQVDWDGSAWTASTEFETAGAMHLANEMLWYHVDEVNGFPVVP